MDLSEVPKVYKNNGACNIIPSTLNGSTLKEEISSIRQLRSSVHSRECERKGGGCVVNAYLRRETCSQV